MSSVEKNSNKCPLCNCEANETTHRLIREVCGHSKCRQCLLAELSGCSLCEKSGDLNHNSSDESSSDKLEIDTASDHSDEKVSKVIQKPKCKIKRPDSSHILTKRNATTNSVIYECTICNKTFASRGNRHYHLFCGGNKEKPHRCDICEKLVECLKSALSDPTSSKTPEGGIKIAPLKDDLQQKIQEHNRDNIKIGAKVFLNKNCEKNLQSAIDNLLAVLNVDNLDNLILAYHPKCGLRNKSESSIIPVTTNGETNGVINWGGGDVNALNDIKTLWKSLEKFSLERKTFITKFHLTYHMETHADPTHHKCTKCDKQFLRQNSLRKHMTKKHTPDPKTFVCATCGANFLYKTNLRLHENAHKDIFPYKCDTCHKGFTLKINLRSHQITHTGEKKFKCATCGKKFARNNALKVHLLTHSKNRPFECEICSKSFADQRIYDRHLETHSDDKKGCCPRCGIKCGRKDNFRRHVRNIHPDDNYKELVSEYSKQLAGLGKQSKAKTKTIVCEFDAQPIVAEIVVVEENVAPVETPPQPIIATRVNVIQSVGNVKPIHSQEAPVAETLPAPVLQASPTKRTASNLEIYRRILSPNNETLLDPPKATPQLPNTVAAVPKLNKSKPYDPIAIYRKILMPDAEDSNTHNGVVDEGNADADEADALLETRKLVNKDFSEIHWRKLTSQCFTSK